MMKKCYMCDGTGNVKFSSLNCHGGETYIKCPICQGDGTVEEPAEPWWKIIVALVGMIVFSVVIMFAIVAATPTNDEGRHQENSSVVK